jgi:cyclopropane-fatty-acyl-phospholipid synthase
VQAHYDLSNAFFELWLDPSMTYSCAVFESPEQSLADAQQQKYRLLCDRLALGPEHHLLEIGTGWGGMAIHARARARLPRHHDDHLARQHALATRRVAEAGLSDRVEVLERDYRKLTGRYDRIVSIEMLEAIGHDQLPTYFSRPRPAARPERRRRDPDDHDPRAALPLLPALRGLAAPAHLPGRSAALGR